MYFINIVEIIRLVWLLVGIHVFNKPWKTRGGKFVARLHGLSNNSSPVLVIGIFR